LKETNQLSSIISTVLTWRYFLDHGEERKHPRRARQFHELKKQRLEFLKIGVVKIYSAESWRVKRETEKEL